MNELLDDDLLALLLDEVADDRHALANRARLDRAPLSFAQQRLWLEQQRDPTRSAYNLPRALRLTGELNADALEDALNRVIDRHDILRTAFIEIDGAATQAKTSPGSTSRRFPGASSNTPGNRSISPKRH
jgi:hypothetical protein